PPHEIGERERGGLDAGRADDRERPTRHRPHGRLPLAGSRRGTGHRSRSLDVTSPSCPASWAGSRRGPASSISGSETEVQVLVTTAIVGGGGTPWTCSSSRDSTRGR